MDVLLEVGLVRVEFYRLREDGELRHLWNFGLPMGQLEPLREHRAQWSGVIRGRFDLLPSPIELLKMIDQRQRALFESTIPLAEASVSEAPVSGAWSRRLQVLEDAAQTHAGGGLIDERLLSESEEELRLAEATTPRMTWHPDPVWVKEREALLHISVMEDTGWFSAAVVYRTGAGDLRGNMLDLAAAHFEIARSYTTLGESLIELLAPLRLLLDEGVSDLLISAGLGAYDLPIHEAALRMGFRSATYSHSLRPLQSLPADVKENACAVLGYAGAGAEYLGAAAAELDIVRALTGGHSLSDWRGQWPRVLHVAGHGIAGAREYETGIRLANDVLSAPGILRSVDATKTQLAFLSACESGLGVFRPGRVARSVPLDVAALEKGCRTVISTSAPVNDHIALIFATTFHHHFSAGETAWESYLETRSVFAGDGLTVPDEVASRLDTAFPGWRTPLSAQSMDTWHLFRFSGDRETRSPYVDREPDRWVSPRQ
ncbi:CHAT domain-containing protein [Leucobacter sp. NPDC058333]|uniref:CHAT domain-containing protein n=1 Tax=Leucobacter sp. NPDC058333 TaxID=3346450 RepID=UPI0036594898